MKNRFTWIAAVCGLVAVGLLVACSAKYSSQYNGLVVVPSRDDQVIQSFSLNLSNGGMTQINNPNFPLVPGFLSSIVLNPTASFAYIIVYEDPTASNSSTGIGSSAIASDGKLTGVTLVTMAAESTTVNAPCITSASATTPVPVTSSVLPQAITIDSVGKYLFVADAATSEQVTYTCNNAQVTNDVAVPGAVSVFSVSGTSLTEVVGSPFILPVQQDTVTASASAVAVTTLSYPNQYSVCAQQAAPTTENLYVTDATNYSVLNYSVDESSGVLTLVPAPATIGVPTGGVAPAGVTVDPCNRFVYVSNGTSNNVSAFTICSAVSVALNCPAADFRLHAVTGSPYATGDAPGPLSVDAYGNFLYVVATGSSYINAFRISSATGGLAPLSTATYALATAQGQISGANSIAIRSDDSFVFVANYNTQTLSEFALVPATGGLSPMSPVPTFNYPAGVAVK